MNPIPTPSDLSLLLVAISLPLVSSAVCLFIRNRISWVAPIIASALMLCSLVCCFIFFVKWYGQIEMMYPLPWFVAGERSIHASLLINDLTLIILLMVAVVSAMIHLYSIGYMVGDARLSTYFSKLGFFTFSMFDLVVSGNLLVLFCCWELVGVSSYWLIGHWREKPEAAQAATKAFLFNRIGDVGFLVGLMILWYNAGTFEISALSAAAGTGAPWVTVAGLCIFLGAVGKSAQFPLLTWLPDAMEGPTPVSALIHAATMVAAGVFLLLRLSFLITPEVSVWIGIIGSISALYGALFALTRFDLKQILAYSTISQLGLMMMGIGAGAQEGVLLHLLAHGFFKACLFVAAGSIIHSFQQALLHNDSTDTQDIRNMGGLRKMMRGTFVAFAIASASLAGLPFTSGFISKDALIHTIFTSAMASGKLSSWFFVICFSLTSLITILYAYRMISMVFFGDFKSGNKVRSFAPSPPIMTWPVYSLAFGSLWFVLAANPFSLRTWVFKSDGLKAIVAPTVTLFSILWVIVSVIIAWWAFTYKKWQVFTIPSTGLDRIYTLTFVKPLTYTSHVVEKFDRKGIDRMVHFFAYVQVSLAFVVAWIDRVLIDGLVTVVSYLAALAGNLLRSAGGGKIQSYILWAMAVVLIFTLWQLA